MRAKELALLTTEIRFKSSAICNKSSHRTDQQIQLESEVKCFLGLTGKN